LDRPNEEKESETTNPPEPKKIVKISPKDTKKVSAKKSYQTLRKRAKYKRKLKGTFKKSEKRVPASRQLRARLALKKTSISKTNKIANLNSISKPTSLRSPKRKFSRKGLVTKNDAADVPSSAKVPIRRKRKDFQSPSVTGSPSVLYDTGNMFHVEHRLDDGTKVGRHGYVDPMGFLRVTEYTAGSDGMTERRTSRHVGMRRVGGAT